MMRKDYVFIFISYPDTTSYKDCVQEVLDLTGGQFGNLEAKIHEAMPLAATSEHHHDGRCYVGIKLRLDYAQLWYQRNDSGEIQTFAIDTSRPLMLDVTYEDGKVIGQAPNPAPYHYGSADILDEQGVKIGTQVLYMGGAGRVGTIYV